MKRCRSVCQGAKEEDCTDPCTFVGKTYCRLSSKYKMEPPGCEVVPKATRGIVTQNVPAQMRSILKNTPSLTKPQATKPRVTKPQVTRAKTRKRVSIVLPEPEKATKSKTLKRGSKIRSKLVSNLGSKSPSNRLVRSWTQKNLAARTIQTFMKKTEGRRKALFYGTICSDAGACIALGKEKQPLLDFFKFNTFEYAKQFTSIGKESYNGFLKEITYEREGYTAHAILKSSARDGSDSLAYEYLVGQYLNDVGKRFPGFVETYGLYHYPNTKERDDMKTKDTLIRKLNPVDPQNIRTVCRKAKTICTLIQHIQHARTFVDHYEEDYFRDHDSPYVHYQIFFTLHHLRTVFTHYDLHRNNVLLYEPVVGKYIQYHYHLPGKVIRYKSRYLVKIIDYGRCFFPGALDYYKKVCEEKACDPMCGFKKGFSTFYQDRRTEIVFGGVTSLYKNESSDLQFLYYCKDHLAHLQKTVDPEYTQILDDTLYNQGISTQRGQRGTMEDLQHDSKIRNVTDAYRRWESYLETRTKSNDEDHASMTCLGDLHVYVDKDLEYVPMSETQPATQPATQPDKQSEPNVEPYAEANLVTQPKPKPKSKTKTRSRSKAIVQGIRI